MLPSRNVNLLSRLLTSEKCIPILLVKKRWLDGAAQGKSVQLSVPQQVQGCSGKSLIQGDTFFFFSFSPSLRTKNPSTDPLKILLYEQQGFVHKGWPGDSFSTVMYSFFFSCTPTPLNLSWWRWSNSEGGSLQGKRHNIQPDQSCILVILWQVKIWNLHTVQAEVHEYQQTLYPKVVLT